MKKRLLFIICSIFIMVGFVSAQTAKRTVTNTDLEKFRQKRLANERSYRENYERLGFPSPEELEARNEQDRKDLSELSARIERENYAREQIQREEQYRREQDILRIVQYNQGADYGNGFYSPFYSGGFVGYGVSNGYYNGYGKFGRFGNFGKFGRFGNFGKFGRFGNFGKFGRFGRGGSFYNSITPGTVFPPRGGVRINTNGVRISTGFGGGRISTGIRSPR